MERFPTIRDVASADISELLLLWEGLGYYQRVRNIHRTAQIVVATSQTELPTDYSELIKFPGIGDYSARAILSIALGKPYPVIDVNVRRVVRRLFAIEKWDPPADKLIEEYLNRMIPPDQPALFNEAMMELGQTICKVKSPNCLSCPLMDQCQANMSGQQEQLGVKRSTTVKVRRKSYILLVCCGDFLYIERRKSVRFQQLWMFPSIPCEEVLTGLSAEEPARVRFGEDIRLVTELKPHTHYYTKYAEELFPRVYRQPKTREIAGGEWVRLDQLSGFPMPSVYRRIAQELLDYLSKSTDSSNQ